MNNRLHKDYSTGEEYNIPKRYESDIQDPDNVLLKNAMKVAVNTIFKELGEIYSKSKKSF